MRVSLDGVETVCRGRRTERQTRTRKGLSGRMEAMRQETRRGLGDLQEEKISEEEIGIKRPCRGLGTLSTAAAYL